MKETDTFFGAPPWSVNVQVQVTGQSYHACDTVNIMLY